MKNKIAILGGCGYIGGLTCNILSQKFTDIVIYDNLLYEDRFLKPLPFVFGDIRDTKKVIETSRDCDTVVLLSAIVGDPACNVNQELAEEVNFVAVKKICKNLEPNKHIIFASTCSVYGANEEMVTEESKTCPLSCYASTKLKAEKYVLDRGGCVFRLGTVFGVGDNFSRIRADLVVNTLTVKAFTEGKITVNGGEQWRPIISVTDIGKYILEACEKKHQGLYNLGYKNVIIRDLADDIVKIFPDTTINTINQSFQDGRNYKVSTEKSRKIFDHVPQITVLEEVIKMSNLLKEGRIKDPNSILYNNGLYMSSKRF
jgi:nucleoside-diphosphate-sugar epimerase